MASITSYTTKDGSKYYRFYMYGGTIHSQVNELKSLEVNLRQKKKHNSLLLGFN